MKLERFNRYRKFIEFQPSDGAAEELVVSDDRPVQGIGDWLDSSFVALTVMRGDILIHIGKEKFSIADEGLDIRYSHNSDGTTTCTFRDHEKTAEVTYRSWWLSLEENVPAFGVADDEDEDFCAYLISMTKTREGALHIVKKYT